MKTHSAVKRAGAAPAFTLLETLLALMIFSTAIVALVEAVDQLGKATIHQRRAAQVEERMRSLLTERTRLPLPQEEETKLEEGDITYTLRQQKLELQNADGQPLQELYEISVTAEWMEGRDPQSAMADTWVYPPLFARSSGGGLGQPPAGLPQGIQPATPPSGLLPRQLR